MCDPLCRLKYNIIYFFSAHLVSHCVFWMKQNIQYTRHWCLTYAIISGNLVKQNILDWMFLRQNLVLLTSLPPWVVKSLDHTPWLLHPLFKSSVFFRLHIMPKAAHFGRKAFNTALQAGGKWSFTYWYVEINCVDACRLVQNTCCSSTWHIGAYKGLLFRTLKQLFS